MFCCTSMMVAMAQEQQTNQPRKPVQLQPAPAGERDFFSGRFPKEGIRQHDVAPQAVQPIQRVELQPAPAGERDFFSGRFPKEGIRQYDGVPQGDQPIRR